MGQSSPWFPQSNTAVSLSENSYQEMEPLLGNMVGLDPADTPAGCIWEGFGTHPTDLSGLYLTCNKFYSPLADW